MAFSGVWVLYPECGTTPRVQPRVDSTLGTSHTPEKAIVQLTCTMINLASSPGHSQLFNVARMIKSTSPDYRQLVRDFFHSTVTTHTYYSKPLKPLNQHNYNNNIIIYTHAQG